MRGLVVSVILVLGATPAAAETPNSSPSGWGAYATLHGQTLDLQYRGTGWSDDPTVRPGDVEAGYGWRDERSSAIVGYAQHDMARKREWSDRFDPRWHGHPPQGDQGVLGLSFSIRSR